MIRKLKSGKYRLYFRKMNPKTGRLLWLAACFALGLAAAAARCRRRAVPGKTMSPGPRHRFWATDLFFLPCGRDA